MNIHSFISYFGKRGTSVLCLSISVSLACFAMLTAITGCSGSEVRPDIPIPTQTFKASGEAFLDYGKTASSRYGHLDVIVEVTGHGHPAPDAVGESQRRLTALQAARYSAMANLVENVRGMQVERMAEVRDMVFASEQIMIKSSGIISGMRIVDEKFGDETGVATVTISVGLDPSGEIVPDRMLPIVPLSKTTRRAQTENAARVRAAAALREQIGRVQLAQNIRIQNLMMTHHQAFAIVEGWLEGVQYSEPKWIGEDKCVVDATLTVTTEQLARLQRMITPLND